MSYRLRTLGISLFGVLMFAGSSVAQTTNTPTTNTQNSNTNSNPVSNLDQSGALINTQVNSHQLGRSIVGNGIADCTTSGISASSFGSAVGGFDSGTFGGAVTYTHSFGMKTCKQYAKTQLGKLQLETCLLLISNYSKMRKSGIDVDYQQLMAVSDIQCPEIQLVGLSPSPQEDGAVEPNIQSALPSATQPVVETDSDAESTLNTQASDLLPSRSSQDQTQHKSTSPSPVSPVNRPASSRYTRTGVR